LNEPHIFSKYGGTRFLLALGCCVVNTGLLVFSYIDQGTYQVLILGTVGAYITGHTLQNATAHIAQKGYPYPREGEHGHRQY
jgi:hypothetical protein